MFLVKSLVKVQQNVKCCLNDEISKKISQNKKSNSLQYKPFTVSKQQFIIAFIISVTHWESEIK